ncbi:MAG TPA: DNA polymerase Y family protein [Rhodanobacteraceae bacterium]|nr:DNA polymerase Y family protein [Rhodanobacteraceae bacterium]
MLWACVLLPSLALDAALRGQPSLDRPFALVTGPAQQRRLVAVDARARAAGLAPGQRLAEAEAVCRDLFAAEYDARATRASLKLIAAWAYRYSSQVLLDPPRAVILEVGKSLRLFGPWPDLAQRLREDLAQLGFAHRIALAPNPRAARVLAGIADGTLVESVDALPQALARVACARAGLPGNTVAALTSMGITTLGALFALPRAALQRRFGKPLVTALTVLLGEQPEALAAYQPPDRFAARVDLGCEVKSHQALLFPLRRMLGDLAAFVAARDGGVQRFVIRFGHADRSSTTLAIGLLAPERAAEALFDVAKLRLEQAQLPQPVLELSVHADELPPFAPEARDLLDQRSANALPWPQLRERLRARLGEDAVYGLRADPDPRPEQACVRDAVANTADSTPLPPRPAWLLSRPIPLRDFAPRILAGPERLETGWWDGDDIRRDYYVLELATGQRAWAFAAPGERGPFMLHGWFA